jgi:hypothetical protein
VGAGLLESVIDQLWAARHVIVIAVDTASRTTAHSAPSRLK